MSEKPASPPAPTTGIPEVDRLVGGIVPGDNLVWEVDSGAPVDSFISRFVSACEAEGSPLVYVSINRSPQTVVGKYAGLMPSGRFTLVDCFSSGKGNNDEVFLEFFKSPGDAPAFQAVRVEDPSDPARLQEILLQRERTGGGQARYVFDSLTGLLELWGDEEKVLRFFGHICPRLYDLRTVACWLLEKEAHSEQFLAKVRHITQVVIEIAVSQGFNALTVRKAANRSADIGMPQRFELRGGEVAVSADSREDRELELLTKMSEALGSALDPGAFFEQTMEVLAGQLGMIRGTLVLLDRATSRLRIAAAHGLTAAERARGQYTVGEGVTGRVVETGQPEVVPDVSKDQRFLNRTSSRRRDPATPISFICVPVKVDGEVVGALSVDRVFALESTLEKDLRLLLIVTAVVAQVLKINRMLKLDKDEILARDETVLQEMQSRYRLDNVVGQSGAMRRVLAAAAVAAKSNASILITGETGTGKELVANAVHYNSNRAGGPLVKVNCGALPESLLESELFGHMRGAFTGAVANRRGRFELADGGTLFLDEVGEMSPRLQVKLLRVLQDGEFEPVGSMRTVSVDVRVVAATNKNLKESVRAGQFREDLYYRLNVIPIHLPPLRERREDIPLLVNYFMEKYNAENGKAVTRLSREVLDWLVGYAWPGNVRELENCIERAVVMSPGDVLAPETLPEEMTAHRKGRVSGRLSARAGHEGFGQLVSKLCADTGDLAATMRALIRSVEEAAIRKAMEAGTGQRELAKKLGFSRTTLRKKLKDFGVK